MINCLLRIEYRFIIKKKGFDLSFYSKGLIKIFKVTMFYFLRKCNLRKRSFLTTFLYEYKLGRTWLETAITPSFYKTEINKLAQLLWNVSIQMVFNFDLKFLQILHFVVWHDIDIFYLYSIKGKRSIYKIIWWKITRKFHHRSIYIFER